jgi:tetratricopeptide (TPR) repeat protein
MNGYVIGLVLLFVGIALPCQSPDAEASLDSSWKAQALARIDSLHATSRTEQVHAVLDSLLALNDAMPDSAFYLALLLRRGFEWTAYGHARNGEPILREARDLALTLGDSASLSIALRWLGVAIGLQGRLAEAEKVHRQTVDLSLRIEHRSNLAWGHVGLGWCFERTGRFEEAKQEYRTAADLFEEIDEARGRIWALNGLGTCFKDLGRVDSTMTTYKEIAVKAREIGDETIEANAINNLGTVAYNLGDPGLAIDHFRSAEALHKRSYDERGALVAGHNIADCLIQLGRSDEAESRLRSHLEQCRGRGYDDLEALMLNALGSLRYHQNRYEDAQRLFRQVVSKRHSLPVSYRMDALIGLSNALARTDSSDVAELLLRGILDASDQPFSGGQWARLTRSHAERLLEMGRSAEALRRS